MSPAVDLVGQRVDGWTVTAKAPAQNRIRMWTARHDACGTAADVAQTALRAGALPPCTVCSPSVTPAVSHGMHYACGTAHLVGTPCPETLHVRPAVEEIHVRPQIEPATYTRGADGITRETLSHTVEVGQGVTYGRAIDLDAAAEVLDVIRGAMAAHPRSAQEEVGPSEIGGCERRLGYRLAFGRAEERDPDSRWRPQVGTFVHAGLAEAFVRDNLLRGSESQWLVEWRVQAPVPGTADLVDTHDRKVIDFKITGDTTRKRAARGDVDESYQVQLDLYALGLNQAGIPVDSVALCMLPASGSLADAVWYERPHDSARAWAAVARLRKLQGRVAALHAEGGDPAAFLAGLQATDDHCPSCPALGTHCPGAAGAHVWPPLDPPWPAYDAAVAALDAAS